MLVELVVVSCKCVCVWSMCVCGNLIVSANIDDCFVLYMAKN